jgi:hypothetical protein
MRAILILLLASSCFAQLPGQTIETPSGCGPRCWAVPDGIYVTRIDTLYGVSSRALLSSRSTLRVMAKDGRNVLLQVVHDGGAYWSRAQHVCGDGIFVLMPISTYDSLCIESFRQIEENEEFWIALKQKEDSVKRLVRRMLEGNK